MQINQMIDHTLLKSFASKEDIIKLCNQAKEYNFWSVCVNPIYLKFAKEELKSTNVKVCCVAGFPLGAMSLETKLFEIANLFKNGCDEVDFVVNIANIKNNNFNLVDEEFKKIREITIGKTIKVILETCYLQDEEIVKVCKFAAKNNIDFVKTSTGFGSSGANEHVVRLLKDSVSSNKNIRVKASGGIKNFADAEKMIKAGASRLGTSNGVEIMTNKNAKNDY